MIILYFCKIFVSNLRRSLTNLELRATLIIMINNKFKKIIFSALVLANVFACSSGSRSYQTPAPVQGYQYQQVPYSPPRQDSYYYTPPQSQPYYSPSPYQYQQPASRQYNNPYAVAPQNVYPYYDGDQYYVPPTNYGGSYRDNPSSSAAQKF